MVSRNVRDRVHPYLMPWGDPAILRQILLESQRITNPRARRVFQRTAVQTGLVESGGRNLPGGHADSAGWRQERASIYENPTNVKASVRRFRQEFQQFYKPGAKSYELAAQIQRPAAQYRGRYRDVRGQARQVLAQAKGQAPGLAGGGRSGSPTGTVGVPGTPGAQNQPMGSEGLVALLSQLGEGKPQIQSAGVAPPEFSAQAVMPAGFQAAPSGGGPAPKQDITALLDAVKTVGGDVSRAPGQPGSLNPPPVPGGEQGPNAALSWAQSKIGFKETGENTGGLASRLNARFGFGASGGQPWCAMFTSAAVTRGGAPKEARTASVAEVRRKAGSKEGYTGFVNPARAKSGDLILFGNDHIGMVQTVRKGKIIYVGGNQSDGVTRASVPVGTGDIVRPKYRR